MKKSDRKTLYKLLEQWTRAEIMARHCPFLSWPEWGQYHFDKQEIENQIRKLCYGTSNLVDLGIRWDLPINFKSPKREKSKKKSHQKR